MSSKNLIAARDSAMCSNTILPEPCAEPNYVLLLQNAVAFRRYEDGLLCLNYILQSIRFEVSP